MNLDELPFPAYHRLPVNRYYHWWLPEKPLLTMLASKGCPFRCIYCPYPVGYGNFWRGRNPENVLAEIQFYVDNFHVKSILFRDQVFTFDMEKTQQLCMGIIERGMDISWACETRVDRLSKKLMTVMKEAGCVGLNLGIESGDPKILSEIGKPGVNIDMIRKVFSDAHEVGIQTGAFFMIGLPGETKQSVWNSFKLMKEINSDIILLAAVTPYPGTELYELAEERGWILTHDWSKYSGFDIVMRTDDMSEQDLIRAMKYWGSFRKYRGKNLKEVRSKSGVKNVILHPLRTAKWALGFVKYHVTNPQKEFEKWALGK